MILNEWFYQTDRDEQLLCIFVCNILNIKGYIFFFEVQNPKTCFLYL